MPEQKLITFEDSGQVTWSDPVDSTNPGVPDPDPVPVAAGWSGDTKHMVLINDSDMATSRLQAWADAYQEVIDEYFCWDHGHVTLRVGRSVDDFDASFETPHFFTNGLDVAGAAGYHSLVVRNGGDIDGIAFTDVDSNDPDETCGHEIFEWRANMLTGKYHNYWGDTNRFISMEVCDPTTGTPHTLNGVKIASWVKEQYLIGDNKEDPTRYDSSHWFGETPRVRTPKARTSRGFQIFLNIATRQIEYEFGPIPAGTPWTMPNYRLEQGTPLPFHVQQRAARMCRAFGLPALP